MENNNITTAAIDLEELEKVLQETREQLAKALIERMSANVR